MDLSKISVVLPSLDPDEKLLQVVDGLLEYGFSDIIMINDGSHPECVHFFEDAVKAHPQLTLLTHEVNRGKGAAMKTAFTWIMENRPQCQGVVTVDGDNQHHSADTKACCEAMLKTGSVILGCRDFSQSDVPPRSRFGNRTTSAVFKLFCGMTISDTQTGLRAIPVKYLPIINDVAGDRYEYETNMLLALKTNGIPFEEVKIRTVYIEENKSSHFHAIRDSWRIYKLLLAHFFRYTLSSLTTSVVEMIIYTVSDKLLAASLTGFALTTAAGLIARVISSLMNFYLNKKLVFRSTVSTGAAFLRYYALAIPQMAAQILLTQGAYRLLRVSDTATGLRTLWYVVVMVVLYFVSFTIQQSWVFAQKKSK